MRANIYKPPVFKNNLKDAFWQGEVEPKTGLRQSQAISNLIKRKNPNFKIQMPNEIQRPKCQNIKSVSSEIVRE